MLRPSSHQRTDLLSALRDLEATLGRIEAQLRVTRERPASPSGPAGPGPAAPDTHALGSWATAISERAEARSRAVLAAAEAQATIAGPGLRCEPAPAVEAAPAPALPVREKEIPGAPTAQAPAAPEPPSPGEPLFDRRVELDVGPFADFGALSSFERAVARLPQVEDVYVRRFFDDRAIVEVATTEELPLLSRLRHALPYVFDVERTERSSLKITLAAAVGETR